jgi:ribulose kinase
MHKYSIGVDFGTLSGRAVLVDTTTGEEVAVVVHGYTHGVMDEALPDGTSLGVDWALQHPRDYLDVFSVTIPAVMKMASVEPDQIAGVGIDFTACTMLPVTADGTRMIIETFKENGVPVNEFYAAGGIAEKNPFIMQIYADIINMQIRISGSPQAPALGSAMFGAVAAGKSAGGFDSVMEAVAVMAKVRDQAYRPVAGNAEVYDRLFAEYRILHDYFGRGTNDAMKRLKQIKKEARC